MKQKSREIVKLLACIAVCEGAGLVGSLFTRLSISDWYRILVKPSYTPPEWVFSPVWIILYCFMGISVYMVLHSETAFENVKSGLVIFSIQLGVNIAWTLIFFGFRSILGGLIVIWVLLIAIFVTILAFRKISVWASLLLLPYLVWVSFAAVLNVSLLVMN